MNLTTSFIRFFAVTFAVTTSGLMAQVQCPAPDSKDGVPVIILQQGATEAEKAFEDERSIAKNQYLEALRRFVILHKAKSETNKKAQEALQLEEIELAAFEQQIMAQLQNAVGPDEADELIRAWRRGATAEEQQKLLTEFSRSGKSYRSLFAELAKTRGLSEDQLAQANTESFQFVEFPAGEFMMGSPSTEQGRDSDEAQRKVVISMPFEIAQTEVTQLQWYLVMGNNPSSFSDRSHADNAFVEVHGVAMNMNHPVENVSWNDAQEFIRRLNDLDPKYSYRLPTEAEWEYAARAGTTTAYSFGDSTLALSEHAQYWDNSGRQTRAVASKKPNPKGLYDVHGNVWEWCGDWYCASPTGGIDPTGPSTGSTRVLRGGSWLSSARNLRSASRSYGRPGYRGADVGFRLVRTPK